MAKVVAIHSYRGGTGKSNTTANLAAVIASTGHRVAVIDTDIQSPGIHILFGLEPDTMNQTLNDYLWGDCTIVEAAHDITPPEVKQNQGEIFLVPSSSELADITRVLQEGYDVKLLRDGFRDLVKELNLDYIFIDTHPGLNEETLLAIAVSNILVIVLRPDKQDFQGTAVMVDLSRKLKVPKMLMVINRVLQNTDFPALSQQIAETYETDVAGLFPNCDEMMELASSDLFYLRFPEHPLSNLFKQVADQVMA
ncbi:MinD/ParA family protein [Leptolyngbyaceae cyanobacterium CCMR0082]|uniref:MinD/ParA family protein n=2 Tax=Adonisia turfae TaxID=2950184 RepID=A0A6M0S8W1_9CYAN|nr:MinD/ParA family protein [Adonisia turfae]NEZ57449.1 MinD/ParA family protein [Adonisia turfae CCMR0081]NEZ64915.1 MinD/ParA family protein [Adonisia turfae CCMR0082]